MAGFKAGKNILLLRITCLFWLFEKLLSWRIWTTNRLLPTAPIFECFNNVPGVVHMILFVLSISLIILIFIKNNRALVISLLGIEILSCMLDQNRIQPWEYQYLFTVLIFTINVRNPASSIALFAFLLASTYFYSGLYKLNEGFLQLVWTNMILRSFF